MIIKKCKISFKRRPFFKQKQKTFKQPLTRFTPPIFTVPKWDNRLELWDYEKSGVEPGNLPVQLAR